MTGNNIKRRNISSCIALLFFTLACSVFGGNMFGEDLREQVFPVMGKGSNAKIAVELTVGSYPAGETLYAVRGKLSSLSEAERLKIPEYLLLKELEFASLGDKQGILSLYATEKDKNFAANERWVDIDYSASYIRENVQDYELKAKAQFGPYIFIKYKPILKEGMSLSWSVVLKKTGNGYLFSRELGNEHIFLLSAQAFPYWEDATVRNNVGDVNNFRVTRFRHKEENGSNSIEPTLKLYYKLEKYSEATSINVSQKEKIQGKLNNVLEGYKTKNTDEIVDSWIPSSRNKIKKSLEDQSSVKKSSEYFKDIKEIKPKYFLKSDDELFIYAVPIGMSGEHKVSKLFRFKSENNEYFLNAGGGEGSPYARLILQSREFLAIIEGLQRQQ